MNWFLVYPRLATSSCIDRVLNERTVPGSLLSRFSSAAVGTLLGASVALPLGTPSLPLLHIADHGTGSDGN